MAFKMNPGRGDYAKTGKGIPMTFKQDNVPPQKEKYTEQTPPEDTRSGERVVQIQGSTKRQSPSARRKLAKTIVKGADLGYESTAVMEGGRKSSIKINKGQHGEKSLNINIFGKGGGRVVGLDGSPNLTYTGKTANLSVKEVKKLLKETGGATWDGELKGGTTLTKTLPAPRPKSQYELDKEAKLKQLRETRDKKNADLEIARQERRQDMLNKSKPKR